MISNSRRIFFSIMQSFVLIIFAQQFFQTDIELANKFDKMLVPRSKCQNNNQFEPRFFIYEHHCSCMKVDNNVNCLQRSLFSPHFLSSIFHFYSFLSFFIWKGRAVSFQNNLFHHLTMKSKIGYRSLIMTIILIVIFSKKELLIKRKRKKR